MISTVEHKEMIEAFQKKEKFFYSPILVNAILALMDMKPAKILQELSKDETLDLPTLKSLQWKVASLKKRRGLTTYSTVESIVTALDLLKEAVSNPTEDIGFSVGLTSPALLSILMDIEANNFWPNVIIN
jgi:hypothetical protein